MRLSPDKTPPAPQFPEQGARSSTSSDTSDTAAGVGCWHGWECHQPSRAVGRGIPGIRPDWQLDPSLPLPISPTVKPPLFLPDKMSQLNPSPLSPQRENGNSPRREELGGTGMSHSSDWKSQGALRFDVLRDSPTAGEASNHRLAKSSFSAGRVQGTARAMPPGRELPPPGRISAWAIAVPETF